MIKCLNCSQPFDKEHWFLNQTLEGARALSVVKNMRCPACWDKSRQEHQDNPSGCGLIWTLDAADQQRLKNIRRCKVS